jgi:hypothetical protein
MRQLLAGHGDQGLRQVAETVEGAADFLSVFMRAAAPSLFFEEVAENDAEDEHNYLPKPVQPFSVLREAMISFAL